MGTQASYSVHLPNATITVTPDGVTAAPRRQDNWAIIAFVAEACRQAATDPEITASEAEALVAEACDVALECGLELPGLIPAQATPAAAVLGAAGGEPDPARQDPAAGGPARHRRRPARGTGRLLSR